MKPVIEVLLDRLEEGATPIVAYTDNHEPLVSELVDEYVKDR